MQIETNNILHKVQQYLDFAKKPKEMKSYKGKKTTEDKDKEIEENRIGTRRKNIYSQWKKKENTKNAGEGVKSYYAHRDALKKRSAERDKTEGKVGTFNRPKKVDHGGKKGSTPRGYEPITGQTLDGCGEKGSKTHSKGECIAWNIKNQIQKHGFRHKSPGDKKTTDDDKETSEEINKTLKEHEDSGAITKTKPDQKAVEEAKKRVTDEQDAEAKEAEALMGKSKSKLTDAEKKKIQKYLNYNLFGKYYDLSERIDDHFEKYN
jgi:hypothetical protein